MFILILFLILFQALSIRRTFAFVAVNAFPRALWTSARAALDRPCSCPTRTSSTETDTMWTRWREWIHGRRITSSTWWWSPARECLWRWQPDFRWTCWWSPSMESVCTRTYPGYSFRSSGSSRRWGSPRIWPINWRCSQSSWCRAKYSPECAWPPDWSCSAGHRWCTWCPGAGVTDTNWRPRARAMASLKAAPSSPVPRSSSPKPPPRWPARRVPEDHRTVLHSSKKSENRP